MTALRQPVRVSAANSFSLSFTQSALLALVLLVGFSIRLYDLTDAPLDFHPTRQLRSAIIARGLYYQFDPSADPTRREQATSIANSLEAYEPPMFEGLVALTYLVAGKEILWVSRVWCAIFWIIGGLGLFALARRFTSFSAALLGLMFYLFLPFSILASRSFQPDPWMVMWMILSWWAAYRWVETPAWKWAVLAGLFGGMAVLVKAVAALPLAGALVAVVLGVTGLKRAVRSLQTWVLAALLIIPSALYYIFSLGQRSGSFLSFWTVSLSRLVLTSQFYSGWLGMLHGLMGLTVILLALLGVLLAARETRIFLIGAWAGYVLYGLMFPYQMTTHEYYHLQLIPLVALSLAPAVGAVLDRLAGQAWPWRAAVVLILFSAGYNLYAARSALFVRNYENEVTAWTNMGKELPDNGKIIALTSEYGNRLKYYGWHSIAAIWPTQGDMTLTSLAGNDVMDVSSYFEDATTGIDYFLVTAFGELDAQPALKQILTENYPVIKQGDGFVLYDLRQKK